jgi:hypothetical protein
MKGQLRRSLPRMGQGDPIVPRNSTSAQPSCRDNAAFGGVLMPADLQGLVVTYTLKAFLGTEGN